MRNVMSHSLRQKLITTKRFDVGLCAKQIAQIVAYDAVMFCDYSDLEDVVYSYDGDHVEKTVGCTSDTLGDRLSGEFFDTFPSIEIEVRFERSDALDVDGYYYHTLTGHDEDGLIEVKASVTDKFLSEQYLAQLEIAIQSVLSHEMQHVVQRCYSGIDMAQAHDKALHHLTDYREIDARVEEVLTTMENIQDTTKFSDKMSCYIASYFKRNQVVGISESETVLEHVKFYKDKMLEHFQQRADVQNKATGCAQMPYSVKVSSVVV